MWNHNGMVIGLGLMVGVAALWGCDAGRPTQTSNKVKENLASISRPIQLTEPQTMATVVGNTPLSGIQSSNLSGDTKPRRVMRIDDGGQSRVDGQNINDDVELGGIMPNDDHQHAARSDSALRQSDDETRDEEVDEWRAEAPHQNEEFEAPYNYEPRFELCQDEGDIPERRFDENTRESCLFDFACCLEAQIAMIEVGVEDHCEGLEIQETQNCMHELDTCGVGQYPESSILACEEAWLACVGIDAESDYGDVICDYGERTCTPCEVQLMDCIDVHAPIDLNHREDYGCDANGNWDDELDGTRHVGQSCNNDPFDSCDEDLMHCIDAVVPRAGGDTPERPNLEASCHQQFDACLEAALAMFPGASNQPENQDIEDEYVACDDTLDTCLDGCISDQMETHCHEAHELCLDTIAASESREVNEGNPCDDDLGQYSDLGEACLDD